MTSAPQSQFLTDPARLAALARTGLVESTTVERFDRLTRLGARLMGSTGSFLSVVDAREEIVKCGQGWPPQLPLGRYGWEQSFGRHVLERDEPLVVGDTSEDEAFREHDAARAIGARAFLAIPVHANNQPVGVLYIFHDAVRAWGEEDLAALKDLGALVDSEMGTQLFNQARARLRGQFAWLMNLLPVAVYACDPAGRLAYFNDRAAALWQFHPEFGGPEVEAYRARPLTSDTGPVLDAGLPAATVIATGEPFENSEFLLGDATSVLVSADVLRQDAEVTGAVVVLHDVTAMRAADRLRDDILALVSHELRTPLTIINGMARVLDHQWDTLPEPERTVVLDDLLDAGTRVERSVENMLVLSRLQHELNEPEPLHMRAAFNDAAREHRRVFPGAEVSIDVGTPAPVAQAVSSWLQLLLVNLLANAELYGSGAAPVRMESHIEGGMVVAQVTNAGQVLGESEYREIFDPFFRRTETAVTVAGAGLGLTVARKLVEAQGGSIEAGPGPGGTGTTVTLRLPRAEDVAEG